MKRLSIILILLLPLIASCSKERQGTAQRLKNCVITAQCEQSKTINAGMATLWSETDMLSVLYESCDQFLNNGFSYIGNNGFSGNLSDAGGKLYAIYPYDSHYTSPESIGFCIASEAIQNGNGSTSHLAGNGFPLYGSAYSSDKPCFNMKQVLSVGEFRITNGDEAPIVVKSIEFTAPVAIAGKFTVDISGVSPVYTPSSSNSEKSVKLTVNNPLEIASGESASFYIGMVPFDVTGNFEINVTALRGGKEVESGKKIESKHIKLAAGEISGLNYTFAVPEEPEVYIGSFELVNDDMRSYMEEAIRVYTDLNWRDPDWKTPGNKAGLTIVYNYNLGANGDLGQDSSKAYSYDRPNPVVIPVKGHENENVTITVNGDGTCAQEKYTVSATVKDAKVEVYNLIPNRTYHYTVSGSNGQISKGYFKTEGLRRIMKVSDVCSAARANNLRDFGGLKTTDGKQLKYGRIFRGTNMDEITQEEKDYMTDVMNIGLDVELRRAEEENISNRAKRILDASKVDFTNAGFISFQDLKTPEKIQPTMRAIINTLKKGKAVYIHCYAGADRTGCLSMLIEALCGVSEKDCTIDYELTSFSCIGARPRTVFNSGFVGYFHPYLLGLEGNSFKEQAEAFMLECGLTRDEISELQNALIEQ